MIRFIKKISFVNRISLINKITRYCFSKIQLLFYGKIVIKEINGIKYKLDLSELIDSSLYFYGYFEKDTSRALRLCIKPDMTIFEVGANIGAHTFEIARMLHANKGKLYSFEPTDYGFKKLQKNFELNDFKNIILEKLALSDSNEEKEIYRATSPETMPFKASWDIKKHGPKYKSIDKIIFERLDDYFIRHNLERLDLLKIDVDGYELRVIKGGGETILKYKPIIIIELGITLERLGDNLDDLINALFELGYEFYSIESAKCPPETKFDKIKLIETVKQRRTMDCLCLPKKL